MSYVTGVVLQCSVVEDCVEKDDLKEPDVVPILDELDAWLAARDFSPLHRVGREACKGKHPQIHILCGGYNYFPNDEFALFFEGRNWREPNQAVLLLTLEDDNTRLVLAKRSS